MRALRLTAILLATSVFATGAAFAQKAGMQKDTPPPAAEKKDEAKKDAPKSEENAGGVEIGQTAPDFELTSADGKKIKLSDYKDKVVVLEWFNFECPYCKAAVPMMKETAEKYAKKGVVWLAVDSTHFRKAEENADFAKKDGITYPILMDNDGTVGRKYGAKTTPHMYIIEKGKLVYNGAHDNKEKGDKMKNYVADSLDAILSGKPVSTPENKPYGCSVKYKKA